MPIDKIDDKLTLRSIEKKLKNEYFLIFLLINIYL